MCHLSHPPFLPEDGSRASFRTVVFNTKFDDGYSPKTGFFESAFLVSETSKLASMKFGV
jgi:hypothetical protein